MLPSQELPYVASVAAGSAAVPSLVATQQTTVQVPIKPTLPTSSPSASPVLVGAVSLLANLSIVSWSVVSGSRVDVVIKNTGLITLSGGSVLVIATA